jgi:cysteinyl-tRNA synthetase
MEKLLQTAVLLAMAFSLCGCGGSGRRPAGTAPSVPAPGAPVPGPATNPLPGPVSAPLPGAPAGADFAGVKSWGYWLSDPNVQGLATSPFDLLVSDYSKDGTASAEFTASEVATIKGGRKKVLAYLSIGEAENYRWYWQSSWASSPPAWMERENADWPGNFKVRYWMPEWQRIVVAYLDRIIAAGFDGAYLDIIDGYEYFQSQGDAQARQRMIDFVTQLAAYARQKKPGFGIFPQNGEGLLADAGYLNVITGIGREETYFAASGTAGQPATNTAEVEAMLDRAVAAGKVVLTIDYTTQLDRMQQCRARAAQKRYVEYCGVRELDRLVPQP